MRKHARCSVTIAILAVALASLVLAGCGTTPTPTPMPTASPEPTSTLRPTFTATVLAQATKEPTPTVEASRMTIAQLQAEPSRITAEVICDGPCLLVVARPWAPGWKATVDHQATALVRANLAGIGTVVPPGRHQVTLHYNPWAWL